MPSGSPCACPGVRMLCLGNKRTEVLKCVSLAGSLPQNMDQPSCHHLPTCQCLGPHCFQVHTQGLFTSLKLSVTHSNWFGAILQKPPTAMQFPVVFVFAAQEGSLGSALVTARESHPLFWGVPLFLLVLVPNSYLLPFFFSKNMAQYKSWHGKWCAPSGSR